MPGPKFTIDWARDASNVTALSAFSGHLVAPLVFVTFLVVTSLVPHASAFPITFGGTTRVTNDLGDELANSITFTIQTDTTIESSTFGFEIVPGGFKSGVAALDAVLNNEANVTSSGVAFAQATYNGALVLGTTAVHVSSLFDLSFTLTDQSVAIDLIVTAHRDGFHGALNAVFASFDSPTGRLLTFVRPGLPLDETQEVHLLPPVDTGEYRFGVLSFARATAAQPTPQFSLTRIDWDLSIRQVSAPWSLALVLVGFGIATGLSVRPRR